MALFSKQPKKVVKQAKEKPKKQKSRFKGPTMENVETVVEVKTVGDIPPALEARRLIGENDLQGAARLTFQAAKKDYARFFGAKVSETEGNRQFFVNELASLNIKVPEYSLVDSFSLLEAFESAAASQESTKNRIMALKKILTFYLNFYEKARFGPEVNFDGEDLMNRFSEIYNYMDIMKLYFTESEPKV